MTEQTISSRKLASLAKANDPRIAKMLARINRIAASAEQAAQRESHKKRKARDAAVFVIGGALLALAEERDPAALDLAKRISASASRDQDIERLNRAAALAVIPGVFKPRLAAPIKPKAEPSMPPQGAPVSGEKPRGSVPAPAMGDKSKATAA